MLYNEILTGFDTRINLNLCCVSGFARDGKDFLLSFTRGDMIQGIRKSLNKELKKQLKSKLTTELIDLNLYKQNYHKKDLEAMESTTNLVVRFNLILEDDGSYRLALPASQS